MITITIDSAPRFQVERPPFELSEVEFQVMAAVADGFLPPVSPDEIRGSVHKSFTGSIDELAALRPSQLPKFRESVNKLAGNVSFAQQRLLKVLLNFLAHRPTAIALTGSTKLLTEMTSAEREAILIRWRDSVLPPQRRIFRSFIDLLMLSALKSGSLYHEAMGYPEREPAANDSARYADKNFFRYTPLDLGRFATAAEIDSVDVVIVGSGAGAGVVAAHLSAQGHKVLILEKGKTFHQSELNFTDAEGLENLFESRGVLLTEDGCLTILAGSTLGGGTTVNWSAALSTPDNIRSHFAEKVPWYTSDRYSAALDHVLGVMGCSTEQIEHSFPNELILEGAQKLGYAAKPVPQNTNGATHNCGYCSNGCRFGEKQGGVVNWLRQAVENGASVIDEATVTRVLHSGGKAYGVHAIRGKTEFVVKAKKVVVAGGSLNTPITLQRSGFRSKHIGRGLKLHPVSAVLGEYPDREIKAHEHAIMTAVSTEFDNLDGRGHGPKIETYLHKPFVQGRFIPWRNGTSYRRDMLQFDHLATMLVLHRDRSSGLVRYAPETPFLPSVKYTVNDYDKWALLQGCVGAADLLYIQGARRIFTPYLGLPPFESTRPAEERDLNDADYREWADKVKSYKMVTFQDTFGSAHQMASCRMGKDRSSSALDTRGRLWDCANVYVADASVLPAASGVNPMVTTMASAQVIAGFIDEDLKSEPVHSHL